MTENLKPQKSRITFISRAAPYGQNKANLCLDMALASAVFEQDVNYIFFGDGVYQILKGQDGSAIESKTLGNALETLVLYGIEKIYADSQSLQEREISESELLSGMQIVNSESIAQIIESSDAVFNL
ncbi:MAG: sulfurtransferase complex subunit TusC [Pseudomonadales bacterium]|jgi:tRNA 2-thiouridine synthesizing protein C|nr:sulfurtransferase complex subunit TusC [Pseudomonadales bacterium]MDB3909085.1 sulfurtransferase complex subunit TusC [Gammaproteobacteria bacterium]